MQMLCLLCVGGAAVAMVAAPCGVVLVCRLGPLPGCLMLYEQVIDKSPSGSTICALNKIPRMGGHVMTGCQPLQYGGSPLLTPCGGSALVMEMLDLQHCLVFLPR
jgi:hypothetical protein